MRFIIFLAVSLFVSASINDTTIGDITFRYIGNLTYGEPTYIFPKQLKSDGTWSLVLSRFTPLDSGTVSIIKDIKHTIQTGKFSDATIVKLFDDLFWANWIETTPKGIWKDDISLVVADGFILPGTTPGNVYQLGLDEETLELTSSQSLTGSKWNPKNYGQFYTLTEFHDFSGNGTYDILAGKARDIVGPIFPPQSYHLVHLAQPADTTQQWKETLLTEGPDFAFVTQMFDDGQHMAVFTGGFFDQKLSLYFLDLTVYPPSCGEEIVIDSTVGHVYSIQFYDLNKDGKVELLVNNHEENNATLAGVYVYELPERMEDWVDASQYKRHQITSGYVPWAPAPGKAAPGFPIPFYPTSDHSGLPYIFLQGDDDGGYYLLTPLNANFEYRTDLIHQFEGTVGYPTVQDVDGDGFTEFFLPDYDHDLIHFYTTCPTDKCSY